MVPVAGDALYEVFKALEGDGRIRRGLFASELGALQFALPPAVDLLRALREDPDEPEVVTLSAADPANAYGAALKWPPVEGAGGTAGGRLARAAGAHVILVNGALVAYAGRGGRQVYAFLPAEEPERTRTARAIASALARLAQGSRAGFELDAIDGMAPRAHPLATHLTAAGFSAGPRGFHWLRRAWEAAAGSAAAEGGQTLH